MKFLLRLGIMLAIVIGGWFWWEGRLRVEEQSLAKMPLFVQHFVRSILMMEDNIRHRVQMVESGATMMKEGRAMIEEGVRGSK